MDSFNEEELKQLFVLAQVYFPDFKLDIDLEEHKQIFSEEILYKSNQILPYLQTVFFEEQLLELQFDQSTRVFFANLVDHLPQTEDDIDEDGPEDELLIIETDYEPGSYLKKKNNIIITPLTPGVGNAHIRASKHILVRCFSGTTAIELGCSFCGQVTIGETHVLKLNFPVIGRINKSYRPYRVKTGKLLSAEVVIYIDGSDTVEDLSFKVADISIMGFGFEIFSDNYPFQIGDFLSFKLRVEGNNDLRITGNVRHITKVRAKKGYKTICGVQFDLENRALASQIEQVAAAIQRSSLREITEKTENLEGVTIIR